MEPSENILAEKEKLAAWLQEVEQTLVDNHIYERETYYSDTDASDEISLSYIEVQEWNYLRQFLDFYFALLYTNDSINKFIEKLQAYNPEENPPEIDVPDNPDDPSVIDEEP